MNASNPPAIILGPAPVSRGWRTFGMMVSTCGKMTGLLMLLLLAASPLAEAAQLDKGKTTKPPPLAKEDPGPWFLAGREGECAPTSILGRKGPEYNAIQSPQQLVAKLQAAGHKAEIKEFKGARAPPSRSEPRPRDLRSCS